MIDVQDSWFILALYEIRVDICDQLRDSKAHKKLTMIMCELPSVLVRSQCSSVHTH